MTLADVGAAFEFILAFLEFHFGHIGIFLITDEVKVKLALLFHSYKHLLYSFLFPENLGVWEFNQLLSPQFGTWLLMKTVNCLKIDEVVFSTRLLLEVLYNIVGAVFFFGCERKAGYFKFLLGADVLVVELTEIAFNIPEHCLHLVNGSSVFS